MGALLISLGAPAAQATLTIAHSDQRIHKPFIRHRFYTTPRLVSCVLTREPVDASRIVRDNRRRTIRLRPVAKHPLNPLHGKRHIGDIAPPRRCPPTLAADACENLLSSQRIRRL